MEILAEIAQVRQRVADARRRGLTIGFVPTMGALHEGHAALIDHAVRECDFTVVSIFVNPLQFGPTEDLDRYPRDLDADAALCRSLGVDLIFAPTVDAMYPPGDQTIVEVHGLTEGLCGAHRPGHFRGVTTVVAKLFQIVSPDRAYFGEKDFQQLAVIKRMVADLFFPIHVIGVPTVREADGLAMSSRNRYLSPKERAAAGVIIRALKRGEEALAGGERKAEAIRDAVHQVLASEPMLRVQYVEVVDASELKPLSYISDRDLSAPRGVLIAVAAFIGNTRLIDNKRVTLDVGD